MRHPIADTLMTLANDTSIEATLLTRKLIRTLYKQLGEPTEQDFPDAYKHASCWSKYTGYSTFIGAVTPDEMHTHNNAPTCYCIKRPSKTKQRIVETYTRDGWNVTVQAYNVMCTKYIRHPKYDNLAVRFFVSRDCAKYAYVIVTDEEK